MKLIVFLSLVYTSQVVSHTINFSQIAFQGNVVLNVHDVDVVMS
jgi:hypothetical protein